MGPVGTAGVEQDPDPPVAEVGHPERDPFDALGEAVHGLGAGVGDAGLVPGGDLGPPGSKGPAELADLGRVGGFT